MFFRRGIEYHVYDNLQSSTVNAPLQLHPLNPNSEPTGHNGTVTDSQRVDENKTGFDNDEALWDPEVRARDVLLHIGAAANLLT